jgi:predicted phosphodiesterase
MRTLVIGDIHGRKKWEALLKEEADRIVFIGDYFDSYNITQLEQIQNFQKILEWKRREPNKVILLFGNHDYHYLLEGKVQFFGYQPNALINQLINEAVKCREVQLVHTQDNYLFTHAGLSKKFMEHLDGDGFGFEDLNELLIQKPKVFNFGYYGWPMSEYGDDPDQGPLWIRPHSLGLNQFQNWIQVVGHTVQDTINISNNLILIDAPDTNEVLEIIDGVSKVYHLK